MQLNRASFYQRDFKGLNAQAMQRRRPIQQDRPLLADLLQLIPYLGLLAIYHALGALDVVRIVVLHQTPHDERFEQLQRHLFRQAALVQLQRGADHNDRAAGVVDAFPQQVAAEAALLPLEHIAQALELALAAAADRPAPPPVVNQTIDRFLQHAFFVADDDIGRAEVKQPLETVVAVDDPPVQIVEIAGGEAPAIQLHHWTQLRRNHG